MRSAIAESVRRDRDARIAAMSPAERLRLALELGQRDLQLYSASHGLTLDEARKVLRQNAARGRRASAVVDGPA